MILRDKFTGATVQVPDRFGDHNDRAYWGMLGPHERHWPDGTTERVETRTTMLKRSQWVPVDD